MVMVVSYSLAHMFRCGEFYEGGQHVCRPPVKCFAIAESLRNTAVVYVSV
jgi:hypothetical protein